MPGGDGTGPTGMGAMTGRAAGFCTGYAMPGYMNPAGGRGLGGWGRGSFGRGGGRGWRNRFYATGLPGWARAGVVGGVNPWAAGAYGPAAAPVAGQETDALRAQADYLKSALDDVNARLEALESRQKESG